MSTDFDYESAEQQAAADYDREVIVLSPSTSQRLKSLADKWPQYNIMEQIQHKVDDYVDSIIDQSYENEVT